VLGLLLLACGSPAPAPAEPVDDPDCRPAPVQYLVESEATVTGPRPSSSELARWAPGAERWAPEALNLNDVGLLRVRVRKGGATELRMKPVLEGDTAEMIALRELRLTLERDAGPEAELELVVDLREVLEGNWRDQGGRPLAGLRMLAQDGEILEVAVYDERAHFSEAASVQRVTRDGQVRPTWAVQDRASVRLSLHTSLDGELRWHGDSLGSVQAALVLDGVEHPLGEGLQRVPLPSGVHLVELRSQGPGVALFGDPRALRPGHGCAPDVVLHLIDTLRRDALHQGDTPTLDRLAETGVEFQRAWSTSSWTKPAIASLHSSRLPTVHQVGARGYADRMPETVELVQERFREVGFRTGSFSASPLGTSLSGLDRGFSLAVLPRFWDIGPLRHPAASQVYRRFLDWLDEEPDQANFVYLHTLEPHQWFIEELHGQGTPRDQYARAVASADRELAGLMSELAARDRGGLVLGLLSDHGEAFDEHGLTGHGSSLYEEQIAIPMLVWGEGVPAVSVPGPVSLTDMAPTLLDIVGLPPIPGDGRSVLPGSDRAPGREQVTAHLLRGIFAPVPQQHAQVDRGLQKVLQNAEIVHSFDLHGDPEELSPQAPPGERVLQLERTLAEHAQAQSAFESAHGREAQGLSSQDVEALRALGYIE
jgi:arylsulfatase A-like enzyme